MKILLRTFNWNTNMKSWQLIGRRKLNCSQQLRGSQGNLEHQSYAVVSDEMSHDKSSVYSFNPAILEEMKKITEAKQVHYWSDGTTLSLRTVIGSVIGTTVTVIGSPLLWHPCLLSIYYLLFRDRRS